MLRTQRDRETSVSGAGVWTGNEKNGECVANLSSSWRYTSAVPQIPFSSFEVDHLVSSCFALMNFSCLMKLFQLCSVYYHFLVRIHSRSQGPSCKFICMILKQISKGLFARARKFCGEEKIKNLCNFSQDGTEICRGRLDDFGTILSPAFRAATVFVGISVIISILCIISFVLFFMCRFFHLFNQHLHKKLVM